MELVNVEIKKLTKLPFNPAGRIYGNKFEDLLDSISRVGIIEPVTITKDLVLVDGHRRLACAEILGMERIFAITTELDPQTAYPEINQNQKPLTGKEITEVLFNGGLLIGKDEKKYNWFKNFLSRDDLELLVSRGTSLRSIYSEIRTFMSYLGLEKTQENLRKVCMWMSKTRGQTPARRARKYKINPKILLDYIDNDKRLPY